MEKTILEWYELLPEPQRSQAIANYDYSVITATSLGDALLNGFRWGNPSNGESPMYWQQVYDKIIPKIPNNGSKQAA